MIERLPHELNLQIGEWRDKLFKFYTSMFWGKPKKPSMNLRNPAPKVYGPKPKKIKKY